MTFSLKLFAALLTLTMLLLLTSIGLAQVYIPPVDAPLLEVNLTAEINGENQFLRINDVALNDKLITALATQDGVYLYNIDFNLLEHIYDEEYIRSISWNHDGTQLALTNSNGLEIWDWDEANLTLNRTLNTDAYVFGVTWSPDGNYIVAESQELVEIESQDIPGYTESVSRILIWDTINWQLRLLPEKYHYTESVIKRLDWQSIDPAYLSINAPRTYLENGRLRLDGGLDTIFVVDVASGEMVNRITLQRGIYSNALAWQPRSKLVAGTVFDPTVILIFDATDGSLVKQYSANDGEPLDAIDWNADGTMLVAGNFVVDVEHDTQLGKFRNFNVVASLWLDKGIHGESYQGQILIIERSGRVTIQDVRVFPDYIEPEPG